MRLSRTKWILAVLLPAAAAAASQAPPRATPTVEAVRGMERRATRHIHAGQYIEADALVGRALEALLRLRVEDSAAARREKARLEARLQLLRMIARGYDPHEIDSPIHMADAVYMLRNTRWDLSASAGGSIRRTDAYEHTPGEPALLLRASAAGGRGRVRFDPLALEPFLSQGGYLRFYLNSVGRVGGHATRFRGLFGEAAEPGPWLALSSGSRAASASAFMCVDDLRETWQLASVPLQLLAPQGAAQIAGLEIEFAATPPCALAIADAYLIGHTETVIHERVIER